MFMELNKPYILLILLTAMTRSEIIKLQQGEEIYCISTDDHVNKATFLIPPIEENKNLTHQAQDFLWHYDDWKKINAIISQQALVSDKRWENFPTFYNNSMYFDDCSKRNGVPFSVFLTTKIQVHFIYNDRPKYITLHPDPSDINKWQHYFVLFTNKTTYIIHNGEVLKKLHIIPQQMAVWSSNGTFMFWKKHEYNFRESNKTTKNNPTTLIIPPGKSHLEIYYSLDSNSYLEITSNSSLKNYTKIFKSTGQYFKEIIPWETYSIKLQKNETTQIEIFRKTIDKKDSGYWAIDIYVHTAIEIKKFIIPKKSTVNYECQLLENNQEKTTNEPKKKPCCAGELGKFCDINCESVLGLGNRYCDKYKICETGSECKCAWGYQEPSCTEKCSNNRWGLSCEYTCVDCENCDIKTGDCPETASFISSISIPVTIFCIILAALVCYFIYKNYWNKSGKSENDENNQKYRQSLDETNQRQENQTLASQEKLLGTSKQRRLKTTFS